MAIDLTPGFDLDNILPWKGASLALSPQPISKWTGTSSPNQPGIDWTFGTGDLLNSLSSSQQAPAQTYDSGYTNTYSSGGTSAPTYDTQRAALYDQAIGNTNQAIERLPGQLEGGYSSIESSYKNAINQLLGSKNQAEGSYKTNKLQTAQDWRGGKNTISSQAGSSLQGLLRLLGIRGAGGGSAYQFSAPNAVIGVANQQRGTLGQTYGRNAQALDTNWGNYMTDYGNQVLDVGNQKSTSRQSLKDQIDQNKASLLQTLATLQAQKASYIGGDPTAASQSYLDQANTLLDRVGTTSVAPIKYQTKAYEAPSLDKYTTSPNPAPIYNPQQGSDAGFLSPYLSTLLGKNKQRQQLGY